MTVKAIKDKEILPLINIVGQLKSCQFSTKVKICSYDYLVKQHVKFLCITIIFYPVKILKNVNFILC